VTFFRLPFRFIPRSLGGSADFPIRLIFHRSPRDKTTEGGETMMIATVLIAAASLAAMLSGFVAMIRD
jgi:hypothetical protein